MPQDVRYALKSLVKNPGFALAAILTLALGIGANTMLYSVVHGVLLRPLAFAAPERLVSLTSVREDETDGSASYPDFVDWRERATTFDAMALYAAGTVTLTGDGPPAILHSGFVTRDFFGALGVAPHLGRDFEAADDVVGAPPVGILGWEAWQRRFGGDAGILGRSLALDGQAVTVVGVLPAGFHFPGLSLSEGAPQPDVWIPAAAQSALARYVDQRGAHVASVLGRLGEGVSIAAARDELASIAAGLAEEYPRSNAGREVRVTPLHEAVVGEVRTALLVLLGAVGLLLLVACANVASLVLARGTSRRREIAIRAALGAGRGRIARQLLTESLVLAIAGGGLGVLVAYWSLDALVALSPFQVPRLAEVRIDPAVLGVAALLTAATGVLFGLAPAVQAARWDPGADLSDMSSRSGSGGPRARLRQGLVVAEVALALMLLVGAALLLQSFVRLRGVDPGFRPARVLSAALDMPRTSYPEARDWIAIHDRLVEEVRGVPGVAAAAAALPVPFSGSDIGLGYSVVGQPVDEARRPTVEYFAVSAGWFGTMGIPLIEGRDFAANDDLDAPPVVVVSAGFARRHWPGRSAVGERVVIGYGDPVEREVVGVVGDVRRDGLDVDPGPQLYAPFRQTPWPFLGVAVRSEREPAALASSLRAAVERLDPTLVLYDVRTLEQMLAGSVAEPRFQALLVGSFATAALLLAAIGVYGLMAWSVAQRRRELGIRLALGARREQVLGLVLSEGLRLVGAGIALGTLAALAGARVLESLLFGTAARDAGTYAAVAALLAVVALLACYLPARRATRTDPAVALHAE